MPPALGPPSAQAQVFERCALFRARVWGHRIAPIVTTAAASRLMDGLPGRLRELGGDRLRPVHRLLARAGRPGRRRRGRLGVPRVGRKDDFFALGGRSLLLPRVRHRLEAELGVHLPLATLLERTTAAALALAAEELLLDELERELAAAR